MPPHTPPRSSMHRPTGDPTAIRWEEPPPKTRAGGAIDIVTPLIPALRSNPKKWARLHDFEKKNQATSAANALKKRPELADIEFTARSMPDGTSVLYGQCDPKRV